METPYTFTCSHGMVIVKLHTLTKLSDIDLTMTKPSRSVSPVIYLPTYANMLLSHVAEDLYLQ
jgi:hypothetical protein